MKKIINKIIFSFLFFILGFTSHKVFHEIYDYSWWNNSVFCYDSIKGMDYALYGQLKLQRCFKERMGNIWYIQYLLIRPYLGKNKFFVDQGWGF
jgi:hypothetical protein